MKFADAQQLHNEDEVTIKETGQVLRVLNAYIPEGPQVGRQVLVECEDGSTYVHTEIC